MKYSNLDNGMSYTDIRDNVAEILKSLIQLILKWIVSLLNFILAILSFFFLSNIVLVHHDRIEKSLIVSAIFIYLILKSFKGSSLEFFIKTLFIIIFYQITIKLGVV